MGCHTWFKKKIETPTIEEMKRAIGEIYMSEILSYQSVLSGKDSVEREFIREFIEGEDELTNDVDEFCREQILDLKKRSNLKDIDALKSEYTEAIHLNENRMICEIDGVWYETIDEFFDVFRSNKWETILKSREETLEFVGGEGNVRLGEDSLQKLEEFWKKYPDGLIELG